MSERIEVTDKFLHKYVPLADKLSLEFDDEKNKNIPEHVFSRKYKRNIKRVIRECSRIPKQQKFISVRKTVAVVLIVIFLAFTILVACVPHVREQVFEVVTNVYDEFTSIFTQVDNEAFNNMKIIFVEPSYIPKGFNVIQRDEDEAGLRLRYRNSDSQKITYEQYIVTNSEMIIDTENIEAQTININNITYKYYFDNDTYQFYWSDSKYRYSLIGNIELVELKKIIESLQK